ncbi:DUF6636 domain-containing protein [Kingella negevensis]|uniref:DUF6636 domain-containing protein n=1 Tax=Kingella negevensis TaxID=1522312 RepID=UPI0005C4956D|nr:DUF6636 domain-containing protein [Kingella negevensis]MDK4680526.1 hypothetical protein [Kingella negevensis]MDK4681751.1 hypothetical protein [Kingella negevensis]MDK4684749.1 hypothetical protein [Kingella negevensis]MDK4689204.1 hypothetical protein [Kingella negevensis]MDK4689949.1 hypothetical protein [Kingella negevensis]
MLKWTALSAVLLVGSALAEDIDLNDDYAQVFTTPSKNILCGGDSFKKPDGALYRNDLYCFVYENKAIPKSCETYGNGLDFVLNKSGKTQMQCAGFASLPENTNETKTLAYGESLKGDGWSCKSETSGLTCKNDEGHGFFVNRSRYQEF